MRQRRHLISGLSLAGLLLGTVPALAETPDRPSPAETLQVAARSMALDGGADTHGTFLTRLRPAIAETATTRGIEPALLLSLVKNGSGFDPSAETSLGAVGLLPLTASAAQIANRIVTGREAPASENDLLDPGSSLLLGSAYIEHLFQTVFAGVENEISRRLLVVAAFLTGERAVARAFNPAADMSKAIRLINRMSHTKVRIRLMRRQKDDDARDFIANVLDDMRRWQGLALARSMNRRLGFTPRDRTPAPDEPITSPPALAALPPDTAEDGLPRPGRKPEVRQYASVSLARLRQPVLANARRYGLAPSLILSVMKNESAFNSLASSDAGAVGLMQLVPETGGRDALSHLTGEDLIPSDALLRDPDRNIELGATYLHLLTNKHLGKVQDETARRHAVIAAYHAGLGTVARVFTGRRKIAPLVAALNKMSADQVYARLMKSLPALETKSYLLNVNKDLPRFADWDDLV